MFDVKVFEFHQRYIKFVIMMILIKKKLICRVILNVWCQFVD